MFEIDKDVKLEDTSAYKKYSFGAMEVGDSFFVPFALGDGARGAAYGYGSRHGVKFTTRTLTENGERGTRIWRIE